MAFRTLEGSFTGTGQSASFRVTGERTNAFQSAAIFNLTISGTFVATIAVQRSFDNGSTWHTVSKNVDGDPAEYSSAISLSLQEPEGRDTSPVLYRLNCTAFTSGQADYRMGA